MMDPVNFVDPNGRVAFLLPILMHPAVLASAAGFVGGFVGTYWGLDSNSSNRLQLALLGGMCGAAGAGLGGAMGSTTIAVMFGGLGSSAVGGMSAVGDTFAGN